MKGEIMSVYFAYHHEDTPILAKLVAMIVVGYAISPIDLIPDFIPILGYLDDVILLPMGIALAIKLIPAHVMAISRSKAKEHLQKKIKSHWGVIALIIALWVLFLSLMSLKVIKLF